LGHPDSHDLKAHADRVLITGEDDAGVSAGFDIVLIDN